MRLAFAPAITVVLLLTASLSIGAVTELHAQQTSSGIRWETDLRAAHSRAQQEGKLLLLHFYSDNCVWCDRLEAGAFKVAQVADAIHQNYVPVKIHAGQNPSLAKTFRVNSFPTDVIVTTEGTALAHGTSPQAADRYIGMLAQHVPPATAPAAAPAGPAANEPSPPMLAQNVSTTNPPVADNPYTMPAGLTPTAQSAPAPTAQPGTPAVAVAHRSDVAVAPETESVPQTLAMDGYCAVSLLENNQWVEGNPKFGVIHLGHLYLFVDQPAMERFLGDPEPFTPVLNGIDVVRFFEEKRIVQGKRDFGVRDPDHNRMFFFADEAALIHFENQHSRYTEAAISVTRQAAAEANPRR